MKRVVYLARHGETEWNVQGRMQGHTDIGLNDVGRDQARDLADQLAKAKLAAVAASDLKRASETASIVARQLKLDLALTDAGLRERRFGVFEGLTRDEIQKKYPDHWDAWRKDHRATPPGAETHEELLARVVASVKRVTERLAKPGRPALIVTHGGALKAFILSTLASPALIAIPNGAIYRFEYDGESFRRVTE